MRCILFFIVAAVLFCRSSGYSREELLKQFLKDSEEKCKDKPFCEDLPDYPTVIVDQLIDELSEKGKSIIKIEDLPVPDLSSRSSDDNVQDLCRYEWRRMSPKIGYDLEDNRHIIINTDKYPQIINVAHCSDLNNECKKQFIENNGFGNNDLEYHGKSNCALKYVTRNMYVLSLNETTLPQKKNMKVPIACTCYVEV